MKEPRWPVVLIAASAAIGGAIAIVLLILLLHAVNTLSGIQNFDHVQTAQQLKQATEGAKIIPQAIATLERHLDQTIGHDIRLAADRVIGARR